MIPQEGQKLFLAFREPRDQGREHEVVVAKVGRKWATIYRADLEPEKRHPHLAHRFNIEDPRWFVESGGFSYNARVWPSREAWLRERDRDRAYVALRRALDYGELSPDVTLENVREAARALGIVTKFEAHLAKE